VKKNIAWNTLGLVLPLAIAAFSIPQLLTRIGAERFGFLSLAWGLVGYAGMLDLGVGRAATRVIAALRGDDDLESISATVATAQKMTLLFGGIAMLALVALTGLDLSRLFHAQETSSSELRSAVLLLAIALPTQAISSTYKAVNEAFLNFKSISVIRILLGVANFGLPLLVALHTPSLPWLIATLPASRGVALWLYRSEAQRCLRTHGVSFAAQMRWSLAQELLRFGGWCSVGNLTTFVLMQTDRYLIGLLVAAAAVTLYEIPYQIFVQSTVIAGAIATVVFPAISQLLTRQESQALRLFHLWLKRLALAMAILLAGLAWFLPQLLSLWLGAQYQAESVAIGRALACGVWANALGQMYYALAHAKGLPRQTALLQLAELPLYIAGMYLLILHAGPLGAAWGWSARMIQETLALAWLVRSPSRP